MSITVTFDSLAEMQAYCEKVVGKVGIQAPGEFDHSVERVVVETAKSRRAANSSGTHTFECGHTEPKSRGKYSALCSQCKGRNSRRRGNSSEAPEHKENSEQRKAEFEARLTAWRNSPEALNPASEKQIARLNRKLGTRKISASVRKGFEQEIAKGISGLRASEVNEYLNSKPRNS